MNHLLPATLVLLILLNGTITYAKFPYREKFPLAHFSNDINQQKTNSSIAPPPDTPFICSDTTQRLLFHEDTIAVTANFITKTNDGNFLIPGYYYPNNGIYYKMPYLIKSTAEGNIVWSKRYSSLGVYPSQWITVSRIKELNNGDLLMTGEIGVPGTDDRRELAVWRLDKNGKPLWGTSYESSLWTNPITGATAITGIQEDANGNIFLGGDLKFFETSKYAFVLKLDARGNVVWDKNYSSNSAFAHGILLLQNKLLLIGSIGPIDIGGGTNTNVLWCIQLNIGNGEIESTKGWYADFGQRSLANSFADVNGSVNILDDGQISVLGTAYSDFLHLHASNGDTINHSIIADFSPDFVFQSGIMLSSRYSTNYYNTAATQHANGRISYTRFMDNSNLYNENIIYGSIQNNQIIRERIYQEQNRSSQSVSNFLFYSPNEDIVVQTYSNQTRAKGGLEIMRLYDNDSSSVCNGKDTSLTFVQPYFMKPAQITFDSIVTNAFQQTYHNFVDVSDGDIFKSTGCTLAGVNVHPAPVVSLDKNSVLCIGSNRELTPGQGYSRYAWNNQSTGASILVSDTGKYWVSVTDQNGCTGSDTTHITTIASIPSDFLPPDTTVCDFARLTIVPAHAYQSYLWSDQSTGSSLTVSQAGLYRLVVTDSNQCTGSDSLLLTQKQCLEGLFVPNAFTPNDDGRNDILRPRLLGNIIRFRFAIYNRWGEKVFETRTPGQGWDGKQNGIPAAEGAFVWYCEYQLDGQAERIGKGTVLVIH